MNGHIEDDSSLEDPSPPDNSPEYMSLEPASAASIEKTMARLVVCDKRAPPLESFLRFAVPSS